MGVNGLREYFVRMRAFTLHESYVEIKLHIVLEYKCAPTVLSKEAFSVNTAGTV